MEIEEKVIKLISKVLKVDESRVALESSFTLDLGADSLSLVDLLLALEQNFGLTIPDDEIDNFNTVADVVSYIKAHV